MKYVEHGIRYLRGQSVTEEGLDLKDELYISTEDHGRMIRAEVIPRDVLLTIAGSIGNCCVVRGIERANINQAIVKIRPSVHVDSDYLSIFLNSKYGKFQTSRLANGAVQLNVNFSEVGDIKVLVPSLEIQRSLVAEIEAARQSRKQKLAQADELLSSLDGYLLDQLGLNMPQKSDKKVFAMSLRKVRSAQRIDVDYFHPERIIAIREQEDRTELHSKCLAEFVDFVRDTISDYTSASYIGMANVQRNTGELVESNDKETEGKSFAFIEDDILFARLRPYLNKVYRAERTGVCSTEFHVIRIKEEYRNEILPDYLATILRSSLILAQTKHMMTGNTHPRLANEDVINLVVPTPELEIQERLVIEVKHRRTEVRRLRQEAETEWESAKTHFERKLLGEEE
ncbi:MAG: restriction endonuclease subunit S [Pseudanabaena sp. M165S2SP1A06QC]|nr:restriction endonuclease subunit S [Pseudanabaena sp. M165S2SP1A06QC]